MANLRTLQAINNPERISSIDVFRGVAILSVVLFHFNGFLPFGFLGVDLFFIVSGFLVSGILTRELEEGRKIIFFKFLLQRGFKIWPSYYAFILFGSMLAYFFYGTTNPEQLIRFSDLKRYLFFYQNYTGSPTHWSFDHLWSLCVEMHFYVLMPIVFGLIQRSIKENFKVYLIVMSLFLIFLGILFKQLSLILTTGQDTYAATHNRLDSLSWGILLNLISSNYGNKLKEIIWARGIFVVLGICVLAGAIFFYQNDDSSVVYSKLYFPSIVPFSFFCIMLGLFHCNFSKLTIFRTIAYYSFNWYLWHPIFVIFITTQLGDSIIGLVTYLLVTFFVSVLFTTLIEEYFLSKRQLIISKIFPSKSNMT